MEIFVGRDNYIDKVNLFLDDLESTPMANTRIFYLRGPGGIGKTKLLNRIHSICQSKNIASSAIIDLQLTQNRTEISLLNSIANSFSNPEFDFFFEELEKYNHAQSQKKYELHQFVVNSFKRCMKKLSSKKPVVLIFDTLESIEGLKIENWLIDTITSLEGNVGVFIAGKNNFQSKIKNDVRLLEERLVPFNRNEVIELAHHHYSKWQKEYDLGDEVISSLLSLTTGNPILATLAIEWILDNAKPEEIISIPANDFERKIVSRVRDLKTDENYAILLMATQCH